MRIREVISEAFDSNVDYSVVRATNDLFTTKAIINNRTIIFNSQGSDEDNEVVWEVDFYEKSPGKMTYGKSGSGGEMKVFSFIINSLKELAERYNPDTVKFSSHRADENRTKLYHRMISKIAPTIGFRLDNVTASYADDIFTLKKVSSNFNSTSKSRKLVAEDWQKANKHDKTDGMSQKAVNTYRRENPGSKLKTAVTKEPSKLKKGSKDATRRSSFCARSDGQRKMHNIDCSKTPDKAICKARSRWNCEESKQISEGPEIKSTLSAILNDIGEPVQLLYSTMKNMAEKYVENNGELKGFGMIAGGAARRWYDQFYFNKLGKELRHLTQQAPNHSAQLNDFLSSVPGNFSKIADELPEILMSMGKRMKNKELEEKAAAWIKTRNQYFSYLGTLEDQEDNDDDSSSIRAKEKDSKAAVGSQSNQAEQIVADILRSLPGNVAGDIRNAIARSPNKLLALQQELAKRKITPKFEGTALEGKLKATDSLRTWRNDFQNANPYRYRQFKNKARAKKDQMAVAGRNKAVRNQGL